MVADSDHPSIPARRLAERLRDLRESRHLTQKQLAKVLGGTGALSIATVSLWEKPGSDRLPPPHRLDAYARLFCTSRSFGSGAPRLLRDDELTEQERENKAELYAQLLELRERAQSTDAATTLLEQPFAERGSSIWRFADDAAISIVCSDAPEPPSYADPGHLNYTRYARHADLDALIEVFGQVKADNPGSWIRILSPDSLAHDFALNHLVIIGGAAVDYAVSSSLAQDIPLPAAQPTGQTHVFVYETEGEVLEFKSSLDNDGTLTQDVGFIARAPHKIVPGRTVTVLGGITSRGVHGAALAFIDPHVREANERYVRDAFGATDTFCILMRVPVRNGIALPPNLWDDDTRAYEWSPGTGARW
jgi:transcriptional regulator with XRE-family HTH domain